MTLEKKHPMNITIVIMCCIILLGTQLTADASPFGQKICHQDKYQCYTVKRGESWRRLFSDPIKRDLVMRVNRVNIGTYRGARIAIPKNLDKITLMDVAPFPKRRVATGKKILIIDPDLLAWGAYNADGLLMRWGPIAPGKSWCADDRSACRTVKGKFAIYRKQGAGCRSGTYPKPHGGARMPYCSFFHRGYAVHAGRLPGRPDSHGCVRTFKKDARWLHNYFLDYGTAVHVRTRAI